jgi:threonine/homoserine/homoserine lactone efflux protein
MISLATFLLFCGTVLAMLVTPGPNMAFLLSHSAACHRHRRSLATRV